MVKAIRVDEHGGPETLVTVPNHCRFLSGRMSKQGIQAEPGHRILVFVHATAGAVGSLLCQLANSLGATIIGTVSTKEKAAQAKDDGCRHVILYKERRFVACVNEITSSNGG